MISAVCDIVYKQYLGKAWGTNQITNTQCRIDSRQFIAAKNIGMFFLFAVTSEVV